ncbi:MAG TPA: hypothetical protein VJI66_02655 [Candidatus Paceibacterota bacterium]
MVSLEQYRKALGVQSENLSDEQMIIQMNMLDKIAGTLFDMWRKDRKNNCEHKKLANNPLPDKI